MARVLITRADGTPESEVVRIEVYIKEEEWVGSYDQIEVWRSRSGEGGPYEEVTTDGAWEARIPFDATDRPITTVAGALVNIVGEELRVIVNEEDTYLTVFTGVDPLNYGQCAQQITTAGQGVIRAYVDADGHMVVESVNVGSGASIEIEKTNAAVFLGLPTEAPDNVAYGRDPRLVLQQGKEQYVFTDGFGAQTYFYQIRLRDSLQDVVGPFSPPFTVRAGVGTNYANRVKGYVEVIDQGGRPITGLQVRTYSTYKGQLVDGQVVVGGDVIKHTDDTGRAEFFLMRGQLITVGIAGTNMVKEVQVPTDPTISVFNLLDPTFGTQQDYFEVRVPRIPYAARRSL